MLKPALLLIFLSSALIVHSQMEDNKSLREYLKDIRLELIKKWPDNKTINLVFHGHSVPAGYFITPDVNTLESYPYLILSELKKAYPFAVINIINTSIGGENSARGQRRFKKDVLPHDPDIIFIDYALNDRGIGLGTAKKKWGKMIKSSLNRGIKIILLTPSPDQTVDIMEDNNILEQHAIQIRALAKNYKTGLVDSYELFKKKVAEGEAISDYMSQVNHPNKKGHTLISNGIMAYLK